MKSEGVIKFQCDRVDIRNDIPHATLQELNQYRSILVKEELIGTYPDGIGYGNISIRRNKNEFYITGSGTGVQEILKPKHISLVTAWSYKDNRIECSGEINASAESLTHAAIYEAIPEAGAVIHIHHKKMWDYYINQLPTTSTEVLYGTPEMADEVNRIAINIRSNQDPIIVMSGHEEGIIAWGKTLKDAAGIIMKFYIKPLFIGNT